MADPLALSGDGWGHDGPGLQSPGRWVHAGSASATSVGESSSGTPRGEHGWRAP